MLAIEGLPVKTISMLRYRLLFLRSRSIAIAIYAFNTPTIILVIQKIFIILKAMLVPICPISNNPLFVIRKGRLNFMKTVNQKVGGVVALRWR